MEYLLFSYMLSGGKAGMKRWVNLFRFKRIMKIGLPHD